MKGNLLNKLMKLCMNNLIRLLGLSLGVFLLGVIFLVFQTRNPSVAQEAKNKILEVKNEMFVQDQVPNYEKQLPVFVSDCNDKNEWIDKEVRFFVLHNPYFVRGDFDGDGKNDYAITVESKKDKREGLLVCFNNKESKAVLLGLDSNNPPPFWRLADWDVETPTQIGEIVDYKGKPIEIKPKGESIVMYWEDAVGVIYWGGKTFRWKKVILNKGD